MPQQDPFTGLRRLLRDIQDDVPDDNMPGAENEAPALAEPNLAGEELQDVGGRGLTNYAVAGAVSRLRMSVAASSSRGPLEALRFILVAAAVIKIVIALTAIIWSQGPIIQRGAALNSIGTSLLLVISFSVVGVALPFASRHDRRAQALGVFFLLVAASFSQVLIRSGHQFGLASIVALRCRIDVFQPLFLWMFVRDFPIGGLIDRTAGWTSAMVRISGIASVGLFVTEILVETAGRHWPLTLGMMVPAAPLLLEKARHVSPGDRRRVRFFILALSFGFLPIAIDVVVLAISQTWSRLAFHEPWTLVADGVLIALATVPFLTAYSVIVDRVLDLQLMVRAALQYALARFTILTLMFGPVGWAMWSMYVGRSQTIADLAMVQPFPIGLALFALGVILPNRQRLLNSLDRRFFREQFDAELALIGLVDASRKAKSLDDLAEILSTEVERALHPSRVAILVADDERGTFEAYAGNVRAVAKTSSLVQILIAANLPIHLRAGRHGSLFAQLDRETVAWIVDGNFETLVPFHDAAGTLQGFMALGEKKSELPYSSRDLSLLAGLGATCGLWLDSRKHDFGVGTFHASSRGLASGPTTECRTCGRVLEDAPVTCSCGGQAIESGVPRLLAGKFRIEKRIGSGGMGTVYRATDLELGRDVAVKALHGRCEDDARRLRREARSMALINHPNLAMVLGLEFWFGRPFLIVEYLSGGTLADRLRSHVRLSQSEVVALGLSLSSVLERIHTAGMLHGDIKPGNIGFASDNTAKLLDFGLARFVDEAKSLSLDESAGGGAGVARDTARSGTRRGGTPAYMCKEALRGHRPHMGFDVWSLSVTLFEALVGANPYRGLGPLQPSRREAAPDPRTFLSDASTDAVAFFSAALSPDNRVRPHSAHELRALIQDRFALTSVNGN